MANWSSSATTILLKSSLTAFPSSLAIDRSDTIYIKVPYVNQIESWATSTMGISRNITTTWPNGTSIFIAYNGDIYVDGWNDTSYVIERQSHNTTPWNVVMITDGLCSSIFVSIYNDVYCSIGDSHVVQRRRSIDPITNATRVAGTGFSGAAAHELHRPLGIYVTRDLDFYVADSMNHRIQYFPFNQTSALTSFNGSGSITLQCPTSVVLDANDSLFIVDSDHHRVVRYVRGSFQCIAGCTTSGGSMPEQLRQPSALVLDSGGDLLVLDRGNFRLQRFSIQNTSCRESNELSSKVNILKAIFLFSVPTTSSNASVQQLSFVITPLRCGSPTIIGTACNVTNSPCNVLRPCHENSTCRETNATVTGYECLCQAGWMGMLCEIDLRTCQPTTCWNGGEFQARDSKLLLFGILR
jgi:hypothetical protein